MVNFKLQEYYWNGTDFVVGSIITFVPLPKAVSKSVDVQWRISHRGRKKLKKAKFRVRETITYTLSGSCEGWHTYSDPAHPTKHWEQGLRDVIEYYAKRNSKFLILTDWHPKSDIIAGTTSPHTYGPVANVPIEGVLSVTDSVTGDCTSEVGVIDYTLGTITLTGANHTGHNLTFLTYQDPELASSTTEFQYPPGIFLTPDPDGPNQRAWEDQFVVIKSVKFTLTEGRIGWYDYTIELERVNCENTIRTIAYSDPFKCTRCHDNT